MMLISYKQLNSLNGIIYSLRLYVKLFYLVSEITEYTKMF